MNCLYAIAFGTVLENLIIIKLQRLKSTRAGARIIRILQELELSLHYSKSKGLRKFQTDHKHSHSPFLQAYNNILVFRSNPGLCSKNNNQCYSCGLSSFRPTKVILTPSRKIRNSQLRFVFLNFSFVCQNNLRWSKTR